MNSISRKAILLAVIGCVTVSCGSGGRKKNLPGPNDKVYSVSAATVLVREIPDLTEIKGVFTANQRLVMKSEFTGKVQALSVIEGQTINVGDALLKIDDEKLPYVLDRQRAELKEAEAQLEISKVGGGTAEDALEDVQPGQEEDIAPPENPVQEPPENFAPPVPDTSPGAGAPAEPFAENPEISPLPENKRAAFLRNRFANRFGNPNFRRPGLPAPVTPVKPPVNPDQLENRQTLDQAKVDRLKAEIALTEKQITSGTVQSPMEGFVAKVSVAEGSSVQIGDVLAEILDFDPIEVTLKVPKEQINQINKSLEVKITSPDLPGQTFEGEISFIGAELDPQTKALEVRVRVPNPEGKIKVGMEAVAHMAEANKTHSAVMVPPDAILTKDGKKYVYVIRGQVAERREVEVGGQFEGWVEVKQGAKKGEQVVTRGVDQLKDEEEYIRM